jgi:hypothetical protein
MRPRFSFVDSLTKCRPGDVRPNNDIRYGVDNRACASNLLLVGYLCNSRFWQGECFNSPRTGAVDGLEQLQPQSTDVRKLDKE